jgi:phenylalanyl-tRNA synthetase beta chain
MQISLKWINELVNVETLNLADLVEKLTFGGFEVEEILEIKIKNKTQVVLDISATANRSDSLSLYGISKEIAALLDQPIQISKYLVHNPEWKETLEKTRQVIPTYSSVSVFVTMIVKNLNDITVPKWITEKLISCNIVPSNNLLDFQKYLLIESGYPFEFYDFEKICSQLNTSNVTLSIQTAAENQKFLASNDSQYELDNSILTLVANETPIGIAGIIESKNVSVSETTNSIIIEASIFNAAKIRQQSRKLGLRTDRSARYEKSLKSTYLIEAFYRLISLLRISNPTLSCTLSSNQQALEINLEAIILRYETIKEILGPIINSEKENSKYISPQRINNYLTRLDFKFIYDESKLIWNVQVPNSRMDDITREIDLIEEIARLHGFNNFLMTLPKMKSIGIEDSNYKTRKKITACLLNLGFNELIHYSLVSQTTFLNNKIELINPLLSDCSNLRSSLLPNLVKTVQENLKQKNLSVEGFEYGHIFSSNSVNKFIEKEYVAGIFGGIKSKLNWANSESELTWFEAKGKMEQLFNQLNLLTFWEKCSDRTTENLLHPYRSGEVSLENKIKLGTFGQIHPILANQLNISTKIYLFEFNIEVIKTQLQTNKLTFYKSYPLYPKIVKDISFIIEKNITFEQIHEAFYWNGTEFLSEINLLDEYRGQPIPKDHTSLCLQLVFQSNKKTLENKEIDNIIKSLQLILTQKFKATIRD